jgi:hypothetical protein
MLINIVRPMLVLLTLAVSSECRTQPADFGPMSVGKFDVLKRAAANSANGYWAKVAYQEYVNGLLEGLVLAGGDRSFCLPPQMKTGSVNDVFVQLVTEVEAAIRNARHSDQVAILTLQHLRKKYPC